MQIDFCGVCAKDRAVFVLLRVDVTACGVDVVFNDIGSMFGIELIIEDFALMTVVKPCGYYRGKDSGEKSYPGDNGRPYGTHKNTSFVFL